MSTYFLPSVISFRLQELEKLASRKLRISAKDTMKIAEKLYTQGFISYPRTETNIFPKELDLAGLVSNQTQDQRWGGESKAYLTLPYNMKPCVGVYFPVREF